MAFHLIVKHPFGNYRIGQRVERPDEVAAILAGPNESFVLRIAAPAEFTPPAPAAAPRAAEPHHDE